MIWSNRLKQERKINKALTSKGEVPIMRKVLLAYDIQREALSAFQTEDKVGFRAKGFGKQIVFQARSAGKFIYYEKKRLLKGFSR